MNDLSVDHKCSILEESYIVLTSEFINSFMLA